VGSTVLADLLQRSRFSTEKLDLVYENRLHSLGTGKVKYSTTKEGPKVQYSSIVASPVSSEILYMVVLAATVQLFLQKRRR